MVAEVADPFRPPPCPWCPGNRGLEYASRAGDAVRAVAAGVVTFAGDVAGTIYVTVETEIGPTEPAAPAIVTYGRLASRRVDAGQRLRPGQIIGRAGGGIILTVRRRGEYVDPTPLLGRWVGRARLVPADASPPPPAPRARLECIAARPIRAPGVDDLAI